MTDEKYGWLKKRIEGVWRRKKGKKKGWKNEMKTIKKCNRKISKYKREKKCKTKGK